MIINDTACGSERLDTETQTNHLVFVMAIPCAPCPSVSSHHKENGMDCQEMCAIKQ